ncbi:MAG: hypothetical protein M1816_001499 [Peltula sp. TS41687]|nr:MAG: hypothetical protein M1816_001499 [Peltula sp. TS41687]
MPNTTDLIVPCPCGKRFGTSEALLQHTRDSPHHQRQRAQTAVTPAVATSRAASAIPSHQEKCSCGRVFHTPGALGQHLSDSPVHAKVGDENALKGHKRNSSRRRRFEEESLSTSRQGGGTAVRNRPVAFVREGQAPKSTTGQSWKWTRSPGYRVTSGSGLCYSDVGDNHALCDKDCGWCGHCADEWGL